MHNGLYRRMAAGLYCVIGSIGLGSAFRGIKFGVLRQMVFPLTCPGFMRCAWTNWNMRRFSARSLEDSDVAFASLFTQRKSCFGELGAMDLSTGTRRQILTTRWDTIYFKRNLVKLSEEQKSSALQLVHQEWQLRKCDHPFLRRKKEPPGLFWFSGAFDIWADT